MTFLIAVVGPTGTGKSRLAMHLARAFGGEIVSADSRQVYRHMDIGTAKPALAERAQVPHHLVDIINPDEDFSLAQYQDLAVKAIAAVQQRGKRPLLVGGSGLYFWAVLEGWEIPRVAPDAGLRESLETKARGTGGEALYRELALVDPAAARDIDPRNVRRIIRALEVRQSGRTISRRGKKPPPFRSLIVGLTTERRELYRRVDARVDDMLKSGLVDEVKKLRDMGYHSGLPAMSSIGYRQLNQFFDGEIGLAEALRRIKTETHRLVRHQYNWFRLTDKRIQWFDIGDDVTSSVTRAVAEFLRQELGVEGLR